MPNITTNHAITCTNKILINIQIQPELKVKLLFVRFKFTSDNGLETSAKKSKNLYLTLGENHMTEKHRLEPAVN